MAVHLHPDEATPHRLQEVVENRGRHRRGKALLDFESDAAEPHLGEDIHRGAHRLLDVILNGRLVAEERKSHLEDDDPLDATDIDRSGKEDTCRDGFQHPVIRKPRTAKLIKIL